MNRTEQQRAAIETLAKRVCVDAGAGSGKTSVLVERIVSLIERDLASLDEIVAITFTEKAATEMKIRLRKAFKEKAPNTDPETMSRWRDMERRVDSSRITTIHSFCASLLREHSLRIGLDPDFSVMAEAESALLRAESLTETVHGLLESGDEPTIRAATEFGARRLIELLAYLLNRRLLLSRMEMRIPLGDSASLLEHWRSTIGELNSDALDKIKKDPKLQQIRGTLIALSGHCVKDSDAREIARKQALNVANDVLAAANVSELENALNGVSSIKLTGGSKKTWNPESSFQDVKEAVESLRKIEKEHAPIPFIEVVETRAAQLTSDIYLTYKKALVAYSTAKDARSGRDFDDLMSMTFEMLQDNEEIRERTARGIKFLLIDEFQDTDSMQLELARLLSDHPGGPSLFVVGDAKQSIYDFRGAEVEVFQAAKESSNDVIRLARNFRSISGVLNFINDFFSRTELLEAVEPDYIPLEIHREEPLTGRIEFLIPVEIEKALSDDYRSTEAELIAFRLEQMCRGAEQVEVYDDHEGKSRPAEFGDVALLFRSTTDVYLYEEALRNRDIPYNVVAGSGFYERQEVVDFRNLLTVLIDPRDEMALLGFLRSPIIGLSDESLMQLCNHGNLVAAIWETKPEIVFPQMERLEAARDLLKELRAHSDMPLASFLRFTLEKTGYEAMLLSQFLGVQKAYNVRKIVDLGVDFSRTRPAQLPAFVQYLSEIATISAIREGDATLQPEGSGSVTLMTIHKSKGLEFPIVVIPDLSRERKGPDSGDALIHRFYGMAACCCNERGEREKPSIYQAIRAAMDKKDKAEQARILYVALTRARDWLLLGGNPKPAESSLMSKFNFAFDVTEKPDGFVMDGPGWSGRVFRKPPERKSVAKTVPSEAVIDWGRIAKHAEPIVIERCKNKAFSVSSILDAFGGEHDEWDAPIDAAHPNLATLRGSLVHRLFELWPLGNNELDIDELINSFLPVECRDPRLREMMFGRLREAGGLFAASRIGRLMNEAKVVERETPFLLRVGDGMIIGTIDALVDTEIIVDYKTGRQSQEKLERYGKQLQLYAAASRVLLGRRPLSAYVYYADTGADVEIDVSEERISESIEATKEVIARIAPSLN
jgi:ATP-dependent helicase/nuclease subunit A